MVRLAERHKTDKPPGVERSVACWFDLAVRFAPGDTVVAAFLPAIFTRKGARAKH